SMVRSILILTMLATASLTLANASLAVVPYWDGTTPVCYVSTFGLWKTFDDCWSAVNKLPTGNDPVTYYTRSGSVLPRFRLPQYAAAGASYSLPTKTTVH
ncbi:MAG: hypothetical protein LQ341_007475, partial [Variospora aurantia]